MYDMMHSNTGYLRAKLRTVPKSHPVVGLALFGSNDSERLTSLCEELYGSW